MSREHDVVTLSGAEYDALLSEAEEAARLREELAALRAAPAAERSWEKYALAEAVNTSQVELNREAVVDLVREAVRFAVQAAGEGFCAAEAFLFNYSTASGDEDWETLADRVSAALRAAPAAEPGYWQDKAEGLEADLDSALDIIFRRGDQGAREWLAMNYPGKFPAAPTEAGR